jgi:hypothetical protein
VLLRILFIYNETKSSLCKFGSFLFKSLNSFHILKKRFKRFLLPQLPLLLLRIINLPEFKNGQPTNRQKGFHKLGEPKALAHLPNRIASLINQLTINIQTLMIDEEELGGTDEFGIDLEFFHYLHEGLEWFVEVVFLLELVG